MTDTRNSTLRFHPVSIEDRKRYEELLWAGETRGCEYSFVNLFLWGEQSLCFWGDFAVLFSRFGERCIYPYPVGVGDHRAVLEEILADSCINCAQWRFSGILPTEREELERLMPDRFEFSSNEGSFDYVYDINDLADLAGRKYHSKRNHCKRFEAAYPDYEVVPITPENLEAARKMSEAWYESRRAENPDANFDMEIRAIGRAFDYYGALDLDGLMLVSHGEVLAMTMGSRMTEDTFDVNFEKAMPHAEGAYAAINRAFARYIRQKYPTVRYLDREEDMGIEGLRRAKMSYCPHHRIEKFRAVCKEACK